MQAQLPSEGPIYDLGYESFTLDNSGEWNIVEETVVTAPDTGKGEVYIDQGDVNSRAMGALDVRLQLAKHEAICDEAFEEHDDKKCCARQIAVILGLDMQEVCDMLSTVSPQFARDEGCTPQCILAFAEKYECGMVCIHQGKATLKRAGAPMLAFQVLGSHGYFFKTQAVAKVVF